MTLKEVQLVTVNDKNYILSEDHGAELFVFCVDDVLYVGHFNDFVDLKIKWVKPILIEPEYIGWVNEGEFDGLFKLTLLSNHHLDKIRENNGICKMEVRQINSGLIEDLNPLSYLNYTPIFHNSKVVLHL